MKTENIFNIFFIYIYIYKLTLAHKEFEDTVSVCTDSEGFKGLCVGQELEQRGRGEQQEGSVDGFSSLQTRQRELIQTTARLLTHRRLHTHTQHSSVSTGALAIEHGDRNTKVMGSIHRE